MKYVIYTTVSILIMSLYSCNNNDYLLNDLIPPKKEISKPIKIPSIIKQLNISLGNKNLTKSDLQPKSLDQNDMLSFITKKIVKVNELELNFNANNYYNGAPINSNKFNIEVYINDQKTVVNTKIRQINDKPYNYTATINLPVKSQFTVKNSLKIEDLQKVRIVINYIDNNIKKVSPYDYTYYVTKYNYQFIMYNDYIKTIKYVNKRFNKALKVYYHSTTNDIDLKILEHNILEAAKFLRSIGLNKTVITFTKNENIADIKINYNSRMKTSLGVDDEITLAEITPIVIAHEIGHTMGFEHQFDSNQSFMSYYRDDNLKEEKTRISNRLIIQLIKRNISLYK